MSRRARTPPISSSCTNQRTQARLREPVQQDLVTAPDRISHVDSSLFLNPEITPREYVLRYGDDVARNQQDVLALTAGDVEDYLYSVAD